MTTLLVLAGGLGTRLKSAVADRPKPLAQVAGRPYLHYLIEHWIGQGVNDMVFLLHYQSAMISEFLDDVKLASSARIRKVIEPKLLGTGGAIANAIQNLNLTDKFMVANADTWLGGGIQCIRDGPFPSMAVVQVADVGRYGSVVTRNKKIISFVEKPTQGQEGWINAGLYGLTADIFRNWDGEPFSLEGEMLPRLVADSRLNCVPLYTNFIDIGVPDDYYRFCRWIESGKTKLL